MTEVQLKIKIATVVGARPQFIKAAVLSRLFDQEESVEEVLIHSGQHYDHNMSEQFFSELGIPKPKYNLGVNPGTQAEQTGSIMKKIEPVLINESPDLVLVYGDTNTTLAAAITAKKLNLKLAHIEAGLRSFRSGMSEEINRIVTDRISDYLFCPSQISKDHLAREGISGGVFVSGDIMLDIFLETLRKSDESEVLRSYGLKPKCFYFVTFHRAENVDNTVNLRNIVCGLQSLAQGPKEVVVALHPRSLNAIKRAGLSFSNVRVLSPLPYHQTVVLMVNASAVITDSGGLQKEAYFAKTACVTLRDETEWVETLNAGHNRLLPTNNPINLRAAVDEAEKISFKNVVSHYGTGSAGKAIIAELKRCFSA